MNRFMKLFAFSILTVHVSYSYAGIDTNLHGDDISNGSFPIGFGFKLYGKEYNQFYISTNGLVTFDNKDREWKNKNLPSRNNTLYVYWDDLRTDVPDEIEGTVKYQTIGEAPNRQLIMQWTNQYFYGSNEPMGTFQAILYEGSNKIKYQYRYLKKDAFGDAATIGMQGNNTQYKLVGYNKSVLREEQAISFKPNVDGTDYNVNTDDDYNFIDISDLQPQAPISTTGAYTHEKPTWEWAKIPELNTYEIEIQDDNGNIVKKEEVGDVNSYTYKGELVEGAKYIVKVRGSINGGKTWEIWSGLSNPVTVDLTKPIINEFSASQVNNNQVKWNFFATDNLSKIKSYRIIISDDEAFQNVLIDQLFDNTARNYIQSDLEFDKTVYAKIEVTDKANNTKVSDVTSFKLVPPPVADFDIVETQGEVPFRLRINNTTTGDFSSVEWDFGDGITSTSLEPTVNHIYQQVGDYVITLKSIGIGGESIQKKSIKVLPDITKPTIDNIKVNGTQLATDTAFDLKVKSKFQIDIKDASGIKTETIVVQLGDEILAHKLVDDTITFTVDPELLVNGDYSVSVTVSDNYDNKNQLSLPIKVNLSPPNPPVIVNTINETNNKDFILKGIVEKANQVKIIFNDQEVGSWIDITTSKFSLPLELAEGNNKIEIIAKNNRGISEKSLPFDVILDTSLPAKPNNLTIQKSGNYFSLNWNRHTDVNITGYDVYRSKNPIETIQTAIKLNKSPITKNSYRDILNEDGVYYYRVVSVNRLGTPSLLSNQVSSEIDTTAPLAKLSYDTDAKVDPVTGAIGQGILTLTVETNEVLQSPPYLAIVPKGGTPITVELFPQDDMIYTGQIILTPQTLSGLATVLFSGRDKQGNRTTEIEVQKPIVISTQGPNVTQIVTKPGSPINNSVATELSAVFDYDKPPATLPKISYLLSGENRHKTEIPNVLKINDKKYQAVFTLPNDAGLGKLETLKFYSDAKDILDNVGSNIKTTNSLEIYQGQLPALNAPFGLTAVAKAGGQVQLDWQPVVGASSYKIYRGDEGSSEAVLTTVDSNSYVDTTTDGVYTYSVTAVRKNNNQTSESNHSNNTKVRTITNAPGAPRNLVLSLTNRGVLAQWQAPVGSNVSSYNLYRSSGSRIDSIVGLQPHIANIKDTQVIDINPSESESAYVVTAVDEVGNESVISNSVYLNTSLLPVKNVVVEKIEGRTPVLTWEKPSSSIVGYKIAVQTTDGMVDLLDSPQSDTSYNDKGYTTGDRLYRITGLDENAMTVDRDVYLPNINTTLVGDNKLLKGIMNQVTLQVSNNSNKAIHQSHSYLDFQLASGEIKKHISPDFSLAPNETKMIGMVVGGYDKLPTSEFKANLGTIVEDDGNLIKVGKMQDLEGSEGAFVASLTTEDFMKGGVGKVKLTLENTSKVPIELVTALRSGTKASNELRLKLIDKDGNILAVQPIKQVLGNGVISLANGKTVVRILPGDRFTSSDFEINVPSNSSNQVTLVLEIDKVHYHLGSEDSISINGKSASKDVSLIDSAYYGEITSISPKVSYGDEDIIIKGQAKDRETGQLISNTKLNLILNQEGFERAINIITDEEGNFVYNFEPTQTDGGLYKVSLIHPSVAERPEQQDFVINRLVAGPSPYKLDIPKNYSFSIPVSIKTLANSSFKNVKVIIRPNIQPTGVIPEGVTIEESRPINISGKQTRSLPVQFVADNNAQRNGSLILSVVSSDTGNKDLAQIRVDYNLSEATPYLTSTPSLIETGLSQGSSQIESLLVKNEGLQEATNLKYSLTMEDGTQPPSWVNLVNIPKENLDIGESQNIEISFRPPEDINEGVYQFVLSVVGDNVPAQKLNVYASVTRSGKGNVLFKASDIYTGTTDKEGNVIPGLKGANITLRNEEVSTLKYQQTTDSYGESLFNDIPAGRYIYKLKANNHQELSGRLTIKPGITKTQPVFMEYNLITVEWNVTEVTIQDKYEITLNATFETDVPAAVVVAQPASVNLPLMRTGEVYYGEIILTNYGLVRADNLKQQLPKSDDNFRFEFGVEVPNSLGAKQRITIPYRVIALKSLEDKVNDANTSGAGCYNYGNKVVYTCSYECANGVRTDKCGSKTQFFAYSNSTCPGGSGGSSGGWGGGSGGWGGGSGGWGGGSTSTTVPMKNKKCVFVPKGSGDSTGTGGCQ